MFGSKPKSKRNMSLCKPSDFSFVMDKVLLIFPEKDFFSKEEQTSLYKLFRLHV